jgi:hypothetical protein
MPRTSHRDLAILAGASAALLAVRVLAATRLGFGDSEALYASYALHPQPAYLDHPGLVGVVARALGGGVAPAPTRTHLVTAILSTLVPWTMALACVACGAPLKRSIAAALVFALAPEVAIGLFAMTPDLLLSLAWIGGLALAGVALGSRPGSSRASLGFAMAGVLGGVAAASKVTGLLLMGALALTYASRPARPHARTLAPWAGIAAGAIILVPIVAFEAPRGWPLLHHRLIDTQAAAGVSWRNAAAAVGGQLAYLSPLTAVLAALAGRELWRARDDPRGRLLAICCLLPLAVLLPLCLWSRVAEPHWLAPPLLATVPAAARAAAAPSRRLVIAACALAGALVAVAHAWVLVPSLVHLTPRSYDARLDLANELIGWPEVIAAVREELTVVGPDGDRRGQDVAVAGPHWVICAQLEAALEGALPVGCDSPIRDDFDDWQPRGRWRRSDVIVWVTDMRFPGLPALPTHSPWRSREVAIERGGRIVRRFTITILERNASALEMDPRGKHPLLP